MRKAITFKQAFLIVVGLHVLAFVGLTQIASWRAKIAKEKREQKREQLLAYTKEVQWARTSETPRVVAYPSFKQKPKITEVKKPTTLPPSVLPKKEIEKPKVQIVQKKPFVLPKKEIPPQPKPVVVQHKPKPTPKPVETRVVYQRTITKKQNQSPTVSIQSTSTRSYSTPRSQTIDLPVSVPEIINIPFDPSPRPTNIVRSAVPNVYEPAAWVAENGQVIHSSSPYF